MKKSIAIFDFDGTLTTKDTMFDFLKFLLGKKEYYQRLVKILPVLVLFKIKLLDRQAAKERFLNEFLKDMPVEKFDNCCKAYADKIDNLLRPEAIEKLNWHKKMGHMVYIVSASVENWILPWAKRNKIDNVLATRLKIGDSIEKAFSGKNCYGAEKLIRLNEVVPEIDKYTTYVYGDSNGDKQILDIADHKFFKRFN